MFVRRLVQLFVGLTLFGASTAIMVRAGLGLGPWAVFHQGLAEHVGISLGTAVIVVGAAALLAWIPLRQKPGIGTIANVAVIGLATDATLAILPAFDGLPLRTAMLATSIVLNGVAGGLYIGAGLGPGPRDGLMTGLHRLTGWPISLVRTLIELTVLAGGWALGGTVGVGTILFAFAAGPLVQVFLRLFTIKSEPRGSLAVNP